MKTRNRLLFVPLALAALFLGLNTKSQGFSSTAERKYADDNVTSATRDASLLPTLSSYQYDDEGHTIQNGNSATFSASAGILYTDIYNTNPQDPYNYASKTRVMELCNTSETYSLDFFLNDYCYEEPYSQDSHVKRTNIPYYFLSVSNLTPDDLSISLTYQSYDIERETTAEKTAEISSTKDFSAEKSGKVINDQGTDVDGISTTNSELICLGPKYDADGNNKMTANPKITLTRKENPDSNAESKAENGGLEIALYAVPYDPYGSRLKENYVSYTEFSAVQVYSLPVVFESFSGTNALGQGQTDLTNLINPSFTWKSAKNQTGIKSFRSGDTYALAYPLISQLDLNAMVVGLNHCGASFREHVYTSNMEVGTVEQGLEATGDSTSSEPYSLEFLKTGTVTYMLTSTIEFSYAEGERIEKTLEIVSLTFIVYPFQESAGEKISLYLDDQEVSGAATRAIDNTSKLTIKAPDFFPESQIGKDAFTMNYEMKDDLGRTVLKSSTQTSGDEDVTSPTLIDFGKIPSGQNKTKSIEEMFNDSGSAYYTLHFALYDQLGETLHYDRTIDSKDTFKIAETTLTLTLRTETSPLPSAIRFEKDRYEFNVKDYREKATVQIENYHKSILPAISQGGNIDCYLTPESSFEKPVFDRTEGSITLQLKSTVHEDTVGTLTVYATDAENNVRTRSVQVVFRKQKFSYYFTPDDITLANLDDTSETTLYTKTTDLETGKPTEGAYLFADEVPLEDIIITSENGTVIGTPIARDKKLIIQIQAFALGSDTLYVTIPSLSATATIGVRVMNTEGTGGNVRFREGDTLTLLTKVKGKAEADLHLETDQTTSLLAFSFLAYDNSLVELKSVGYSGVHVKALKPGTTTLLAYYTDSEGRSYTGTIEINIFEDTPAVKLTFDTDARGERISQDDEVLFSLDSEGFSFSGKENYTWTIDGKSLEDSGENLIASEDGLRGKLTPGKHTVHLQVSDPIYQITVEDEKEVEITSEPSESSTLAFAQYDSTHQKILETFQDDVYLDLNGDDFELTALLNDSLNPDLTYNWSLSNDIVLSQKHQSNTYVAFQPEREGDVTLTCMVNVGRISDKWVSREIKIHVVKVEDVVVVPGEKYYKPGAENASFTLMGVDRDGNQHDFENMDVSCSVFIAKEEQDYQRDDNTLTFAKLRAGDYSFQLVYKDKVNKTFSYEVTNFSLKRFVKNILPYLGGLAVLVIGAIILLRAKKNNLLRVKEGIEKLEEYLKKNRNLKEEDKKKVLATAHHKINKLCSLNDYCVNSGSDEAEIASHPLYEIRMVIVQAKNDNLPADKVRRIFSHLVYIDLPKLLEIEKQVLEAHDAFIKEQKKNNKADKPSVFTHRKRVKNAVDLTVYENEEQHAEAFDSSERANGEDDSTEELDQNDTN